MVTFVTKRQSPVILSSGRITGERNPDGPTVSLPGIRNWWVRDFFLYIPALKEPNWSRKEHWSICLINFSGDTGPRVQLVTHQLKGTKAFKCQAKALMYSPEEINQAPYHMLACLPAFSVDRSSVFIREHNLRKLALLWVCAAQPA